MNLRTAKIELKKPPKVQLNSLVIEAVGMCVVAYALVGVIY